jgi:hypothetical protein
VTDSPEQQLLDLIPPVLHDQARELIAQLGGQPVDPGTAALEAAMERLQQTYRAYQGDNYGRGFVPGLSRAVEVVQRVMLERQEERS